MRTVRLRRPHKNQFMVYMTTMCCLTFSLVFVFTQCVNVICNGLSQDRWLPVFSEETDVRRLEDMTKDIITTLNNTVIKYPTFSTTKPIFLDQHDKKLFWSNSDNQIQSRLPYPQQLVGQIKVLKNHVIHSDQNCGWQTNQTFAHDLYPPRSRVRKHLDYVCPLLVPQSNSFQHFIDGVLPKLMQVFHIVNNTNLKILLFRSWDRNIEQMLFKIGISSERIVYYDSGLIFGKYVLDTCVTPPLHPSLWNMARNHLGVNVNYPVRNKNGYVVYISRTGSRNYGRNIKNEEEVIAFLHWRYSTRFQFFQKAINFKETMGLFKNTRILIGVHGGALYNLLFCPRDTEIIEIMPTIDTGDVVPNSLAHTIIWKMSSMLKQNYWRFPSEPLNKLGDVKPDINKLEKVLNVIDNAHGLKKGFLSRKFEHFRRIE